MRVYKKYKNLTEESFIPLNLSKRVLRFNKTKWLKIKRIIKKFLRKRAKLYSKKKLKLKKKEVLNYYFNCVIKKKLRKTEKTDLKSKVSNLLLFFDFEKKKKKVKKNIFLEKKKLKKKIFFKLTTIKMSRFWLKTKRYFKKALISKNYYNQRFDFSLSSKYLKKSLFSSKKLDLNFVFQNCLIKPELKLTILLWRLNFFRTSFDTQNFLKKDKVILNNKLWKNENYVLQKGDTILLPKSFNIRYNKKLKIKSRLFYNYIDIDFFSNTIVILKSFSELSNENFFLELDNKKFDVQDLRSYFQ